MLNIYEYQSSIEVSSSVSKKVRIGGEEVRLHRNPKWYVITSKLLFIKHVVHLFKPMVICRYVYKPNKCTDSTPVSKSTMRQPSFSNSNRNKLLLNDCTKKYGMSSAWAPTLNACEVKSPVEQLKIAGVSPKQKKAATDTASEHKIAKKRHEMELKRKEANLQRIAIRNLISNG
jgi:hypothetical protein